MAKNKEPLVDNGGGTEPPQEPLVDNGGGTEPPKGKGRFKVKKGFTACEDGCVVNTYPAGEYDELPPVALEHGFAIGAFDDESAKVVAELLGK